MSTEPKIRDLLVDDIQDCWEIVKSHWGKNAANRAYYEMETTFEPATSVPHYLIATIGDEIVGFAGFRDSWFMTGAHELIWINVKRGFQGKGIGRLLTQKREEIIKWMGGTIIVLMTKEIQFFQKMGYVAHHRYDGWWLMSKQVGTIELGSDL